MSLPANRERLRAAAGKVRGTAAIAFQPSATVRRDRPLKQGPEQGIGEGCLT